MDSQEQRLQQEILADAQKKAEHIRAKALTEKERMLKKFQQELAVRRKERLAEVEAEIAQQTRNIENSLGMEKRKHWLRNREDSIQQLFTETKVQAEQISGSDREQSLALLAEEALTALADGEYQVQFAPRDGGLITLDWLTRRSQAALGEQAQNCSFKLQPSADIEGGIRFVACNHSRSFDNTYAARLNLLQDKLRSLLAE